MLLGLDDDLDTDGDVDANGALGGLREDGMASERNGWVDDEVDVGRELYNGQACRTERKRKLTGPTLVLVAGREQNGIMT